MSLKRATEVSEKVGFAELEWKHHNFFNIKTGEWDLRILLFNYWNDFVLDSLETYIHEVGASFVWKEPPRVSESVVFGESE